MVDGPGSDRSALDTTDAIGMLYRGSNRFRAVLNIFIILAVLFVFAGVLMGGVLGIIANAVFALGIFALLLSMYLSPTTVRKLSFLNRFVAQMFEICVGFLNMVVFVVFVLVTTANIFGAFDMQARTHIEIVNPIVLRLVITLIIASAFFGYVFTMGIFMVLVDASRNIRRIADLSEGQAKREALISLGERMLSSESTEG